MAAVVNNDPREHRVLSDVVETAVSEAEQGEGLQDTHTRTHTHTDIANYWFAAVCSPALCHTYSPHKGMHVSTPMWTESVLEWDRACSQVECHDVVIVGHLPTLPLPSHFLQIQLLYRHPYTHHAWGHTDTDSHSAAALPLPSTGSGGPCLQSPCPTKLFEVPLTNLLQYFVVQVLSRLAVLKD